MAQGGPPPGLQASPSGPAGPPSPQGGDPVTYLKLAMEAVLKAGQAETDEEDKAALAKVFAQLQQIMAKDQKEKDAAMGTTPAHKYMRSQAGNQP